MNITKQYHYFLLSSFLLLAIILTGCKEKTPPPQIIRPVLTQQVEIKDYQQEATYAGEVTARYEMSLGFQINGKITERFVEVGDVVVPGSLLAKLDPKDYQLQLMEAEAGLAAAKAEKNKANKDLKRYSQLFNDKLISATTHLEYSNAVDVANARYKQSKAHLEVARNQTVYTSLFADKGGVITALNMEVGQVITAGQIVVNMALPQEKEVLIAVSENHLDDLRQADEIKIQLWIDQQTYYKGKVREISPRADPMTRTYQTKISLLESGPEVKLGMTTTVLIMQKKQMDIVKLPLTAIYQKDNKPAVWIYSTETSKVNVQSVEVEEYQYNSVLIRAGLKQGQHVVIAGVHKLNPGQQVRQQTGRL